MIQRDPPNGFVLKEQILEVLRMYGIQVASYVDLPVLLKMSMLENSSKVNELRTKIFFVTNRSCKVSSGLRSTVSKIQER